jgi:inosine/xanthosine triphosphate pyrophosphatase family protein
VAGVRHWFDLVGIKVQSLTDVGMPMPPLRKGTDNQIAIAKVRSVSAMSGHAALIEMSSFCIEEYDPSGQAVTIRLPLQSAQDLSDKFSQLMRDQTICSCCAPTEANLRIECLLVLAWPDGTFVLTEKSLRGSWGRGPETSKRGRALAQTAEELMIPDGEQHPLTSLDLEKQQALSPRNRAYEELLQKVGLQKT